MGATLSKTISGWGLILGTVAWLAGRRRLAAFLYRVVGAGGVGAAYGYWAGQRNVRVEPVAVWRTRPWEDSEWRASMIFHGSFWILAELVDP